MSIDHTFEAEVRRLRDNIYGPCTDNNWENCKDKWMQPERIQWLRDHQPSTKGQQHAVR
jgi:hypothetical protein